MPPRRDELTIWEAFALERAVAHLTAHTGWPEREATALVWAEHAACAGREPLLGVAERLARQAHIGMLPPRLRPAEGER